MQLPKALLECARGIVAMTCGRFSRQWLGVGVLLLLLVSGHLSLISDLHAQSGGPPGAFVYAVVIDPSNPSTIYAATSGGIFKTTDGGGSWNLTVEISSRQFLVVEPANPSTLYTIRSNRINRTTDGGATWTLVGPPLASGAALDAVRSLAVDPSNPGTVYAGTATQVLKTTDGGAHWTDITNGGLPFLGILAVAVDPSDPAVVYAGTNGGVFKTTDGGANWTSSGPQVGIVSLAIDPSNSATLYTGTDDGQVLKTTDGGATWESSNGLSDPGWVFSLTVDPSNPATVYAGTETGGLFKTTNGGATWGAVLPDRLVYSIAVDPVNPDTVYAGTDLGVYKSSDGSASWRAANSGLNGQSVPALAVHPSNPSTVYAGVPGGVFKTATGGASWTGPSHFRNLTSVAVDPHNPDTLYAGADGEGVFKSTDAGGHWITASSGLTGNAARVLTLSIDPSNPAIIYAGTIGGVFKSTNGGADWSEANSGLTNSTRLTLALAIDPSNPATLYRTSGSEVYRSNDGGASWTSLSLGNINRGGTIRRLVINPLAPATLYVISDSGLLYQTTDGGNNWTEHIPPTFFICLAFDPSNADTLYAGTSRGVYKSTDGGANWIAGNPLLPNVISSTDDVNTLVIAPSDPSVFYAGTAGAGVFKSTDAGATWQPTGAVLEGEPPVIVAPADPAVNEGGVVNNASFAPSPAPVAPGSIVAVFGADLNDGSMVNFSSFGPDGRLVTTLGGASVTVGSIPAPVFYSFPMQLGIQIPYEAAGQTSATIQVTVGERTSAEQTISLTDLAPGVFTANNQGTGAAAVLHEDGATPVSASAPARRGEIVILYATGLGGVTPPLATGEPSAGNQTVTAAQITIDDLNADVVFSGAAPGFVGLYQINFRIPSNTRIGADVPLSLSIGGKQSNPVTIAVGE